MSQLKLKPQTNSLRIISEYINSLTSQEPLIFSINYRLQNLKQALSQKIAKQPQSKTYVI